MEDKSKYLVEGSKSFALNLPSYLKTGKSFLRMPKRQEMKMWATTESQAGRTLSGTSDSMLSHT